MVSQRQGTFTSPRTNPQLGGGGGSWALERLSRGSWKGSRSLEALSPARPEEWERELPPLPMESWWPKLELRLPSCSSTCKLPCAPVATAAAASQSGDQRRSVL